MSIDIVDLRDFYASPLGQWANNIIGQKVTKIWPDLRGNRLLGLGYSNALLEQYQENCERVFCFMPAQQGICHWPAEGPGRMALVEDDDLPLCDAALDNIILMHSVEMSWHADHLLRECHRTLAMNGKIILIIPNRRGMWAQADHTPFGHGRPYSRTQLKRLLRETGFSIVKWEEAFYMPPLSLFLRTARLWEKCGQYFPLHIGGIYIVEAQRQNFTGTAIPVRRKFALQPAPVLKPISRTKIS